VTGGRKKLHNEEIHNVYSSPSIIRMVKSTRVRWAEHAARMRSKRNAYRLWVGKPKGYKPLGRPRRRLVVNVKMDLGEIGCSGVDWIYLAQDRDNCRAVVSTVTNLGDY
jgi:hypothetical protein